MGRSKAKRGVHPPILKPQGEKDGCKHTPRDVGDPYQRRKSYRVERIVAKALSRGKPRYEVKWEDIPDDGITWEPESNLKGQDGKDAIDAFEDEQRLLLEQVFCFIALLFYCYCYSFQSFKSYLALFFVCLLTLKTSTVC